MINKKYIIAGSLLAALSVALGAFGAHAWKEMLVNYGRLDTFETAVRYQFFHSIGLILIGILSVKWPSVNLNIVGMLMSAGMIIFSTSLYLICFTGVLMFGAITPIGGLLLISSWLVLAWKVYKS